MFVKERAMYTLGRFDEAYDVDFQISMAANASDDKKCIDKKQLLLEAKINTQIGNSNMSICKTLIKICPECLTAYVMLRREALKNGKALATVENSENDDNEQLVVAFNDKEVPHEEFEQLLAEAEKDGKAFARLGRRIGQMS